MKYTILFTLIAALACGWLCLIVGAPQKDIVENMLLGGAICFVVNIMADIWIWLDRQG